VFSRSSSFYELLEIPPDADRSTVMNAWMDKRRAAVGMTAVLGTDEVGALCSRLDEAFRTLTHPLRGKRYQHYHRLSQDSPPPPVREPVADSALPSILDVSVRRAGKPGSAEPVAAAPGAWVQMSLPLLGYAEEEAESATRPCLPSSRSATSVSASDELQAPPDSAAAFEVGAAGLLTGALLDTLELLEETLNSEPGVSSVKFRVV